MANQPYLIKHQDRYNLSMRVYWVCDTDADKPISGLNVGDLAWAVDTGILYVATSSTVWAEVSRALAPTFETSIRLKTAGPRYTTLVGTTSSYDHNVALPSVDGALTLVGNANAYPPASNCMRSVGHVNNANSLAANLVLTSNTQAGFYRIAYTLRCSVADVAAGTIQVGFTYNDGVAATTDSSATVALVSTANRTQGSFVFYSDGTNILMNTTLVGILGTSRFNLFARVEHLGYTV